MCGICGVVALDRPPETATTEALLGALRHRGPDGEGFFEAPGVALGHTRLAIIDLSDGGRQPFASEDGSLQLLHNGEVYNYRELRAELEAHGHRFRSATDTEVVLAAYREWGDACVERFNGMWALALWDGARRRLFCARDRFGVKPFYYRSSGSRFVFASEPAALLRDPAYRPGVNERAVRDFVEQGYTDHLGESFFAGITPLPAAHTLVVDEHGLRTRRYWRLEPAPADGDAAEEFRQLFLDSVRLRLRSDVPIGTALSGGLDSSAIAVTIDLLFRTERESALQVGERQRTFTVFFEDAGFDERPYAEAVAERIGASAHWLSFDDAALVDVLPEVVRAQGEPFGSSSVVAQWHVMRAAREAGLKVMLDGQGGDEVLAGYPTTWPYRFADLLAAGRLRSLAREVRSFGGGAPALAVALGTPFLPERARWRLRGRRGAARSLVHSRLHALEPTRLQTHANGLPDRLRRTYASILLERGLPELLRYEDRNSMTHSLESRVPFLDYRLVELAYGLPATELFEGGTTKRVLRRALADLLPPAVRDRRDKLGFVTPEGRFLRGRLGELAAATFASPACRDRGFVDGHAALARLEAHRSGRLTAGFELWRALSVELWAAAYLD
jgi:asparagine synthase (glutamine-hydrolysing)